MLATVVDIRHWLHDDAAQPIALRHERDRALALLEPALAAMAGWNVWLAGWLSGLACRQAGWFSVSICTGLLPWPQGALDLRDEAYTL